MPSSVRLAASGVELWFGAEDTPVPPDPPGTTSSPSFTAGLIGAKVGDSVSVRFSVDGKQGQIRLARLRTGVASDGRKASFLSGELTGLRHGMEVSYAIVFERKTPQGVLRLPTESRDGQYPYRFVYVAKGSSPQPESPPSPGPEPGGTTVTPTHGPATDDGLAKSQGLTIVGSVVNDGGEPQAGLSVRALRKTLRAELLLGDSLSTADGVFRIACVDMAPAAPTVVCGYDNEREIARSELICETSGEITVNLFVLDPAFRMASEYERLMSAVTPLLQDIAIASLSDGDLDVLTCAARRPRLQLDSLRAAAQIATGGELSVAAVYGMLRAGLPATRAGLLAETERIRRDALLRAIARRVVPGMTDDKVAGVLSVMRSLSIDDALNESSDTSLSPLLKTVLPEPALQRAVLTAYVQHQGGAEDFWTSLAAVPGLESAESRDQLRLVVGLGAVALGHVPLVKVLLASRPRGAIRSLRDLAKLTSEDWRNLVATSVEGEVVGAPKGTPGDTDSERQAFFAANVASVVADAFPTAVVAARMSLEPAPAAQGVGRFLDAHPDLDLAGTSVTRYLSDHPEEAATLGALGQPLLAQTQRLFKVTADAAEISALRNAGYGSAWSIAGSSPKEFALQMSTIDGGQERALALHVEASQRVQTALYIMAAYSGNAAGPGTPATPPPTAVADANARATLLELFGPETVCACEDYQALDGPWAYFVSLLEFLPPDARAELKKRRPDLWALRFSKANSETSDRYLSLALEVLENAAIDRQRELDGQARQGWPANQTTWTADQLAAAPEHPNPTAYTPLLGASFPWSLPFDAAAEEARAFGSVLGIDRYGLMETLQSSSGGVQSPSDQAIAAEYLGLPSRAWDFITRPAGTPGGATLSEVYPGISDWGQAHVADLLDRTGLAADELVALLNTRFVNPPETPLSSRMGIQSSDGTCNASSGTLVNVNDGALDRIHRFVRLWRALGWEMTEVDRAIWALSRATLDGPGLLRITHVARLRKEISVPLFELLVWWAPLDTYPDTAGNSHYKSLFLDPTVVDPVDSAFLLAEPPSELQVPTTALLDHLPSVVAGLGLTAEDVKALAPVGTQMTLASLSSLYRAASLSRALNLKIADYLKLRNLIAVDPFADPRDARNFITLVRKAQRSGFTPTEIAYLLADDPSTDSTEPLGLENSQVSLIARELQVALVTVAADEDAAAAEPQTAETWRNRLSALLRPSQVDTACAIIEGFSSLSPADQTAFVAQQLSFLPASASALVLSALPSSDPQRSDAIAARYSVVIPLLVPFVGIQKRQGVVIKKLADRYALSLDVTVALLSRPFSSPIPLQGADASPSEVLIDRTFWTDPPNPDTVNAAAGVLRRLDKHALLVKRLRLRKDEPARCVLAATDPVRGWLDLNDLPISGGYGSASKLEALIHLVDYAALRDRQPRGAASLFDVFDLAATPNPPSNFVDSTILPALVDRMGWDVAALAALAGSVGLGYNTADFSSEANLRRLSEAFTFLARSGIAAQTLVGWTVPQVTATVAGEIVRATRSFVGSAQWTLRAGPIRDRLLEGRRDALVAYFRGVGLHGSGGPPSTAFPDEKDLFDRYHIDFEMGSVFLTTRLRLALTSIQLFVDRCLMNLEPFHFEAEKARQWKDFLSRYRVWQAAVDILLTPHAFTDITLLDRKNERYLTFERALAQKDVTLPAIEDGLRTYLSDLLEISHLTVAGMYQDSETGILHIVARTPASPAVYYYARREGGVWSSYARIHADINASGAVLPVMFQNQLYVIWPMVSLKPDDDDPPSWVPGTNLQPQKQKKHVEIQIGWTVLRNGKWTSKRLSDPISTATTGLDLNPDDQDLLILKALVEQVDDQAGSHQELRVVCNLIGEVPETAADVAAPPSQSPRDFYSYGITEGG